MTRRLPLRDFGPVQNRSNWGSALAGPGSILVFQQIQGRPFDSTQNQGQHYKDMPFDISLVHYWHFYLFLGVFLIVHLFLHRKSKQQEGGIPKVGFALLAITTIAALFFIPSVSQRIGFGIAALLIALVGKVDEVDPLSSRTQLAWQLIIATIVVIFGWTIPYVSNPISGGVISLGTISISAFLIPGSIIAIIWLIFFINAINWLDGIDGLAGGVVLVAQITLIGISLLPSTQDATTLALATIGAASLSAFLIHNFPPARVYLGTVGSWFIGLYIALIAMQGGGKIVTTTLVLALPVLDMLFVIAHRTLSGRMPWQGDTVSHLHHRLQNLGIKPKQITLAAMTVTIALAAASMLLPTVEKIMTLTVVTIGFTTAFIHYSVKTAKQL